MYAVAVGTTKNRHMTTNMLTENIMYLENVAFLKCYEGTFEYKAGATVTFVLNSLVGWVTSIPTGKNNYHSTTLIIVIVIVVVLLTILMILIIVIIIIIIIVVVVAIVVAVLLLLLVILRLQVPNYMRGFFY